MESTEKRKRPANGGVDGRRTRAREGKEGQTATEDEVEEFFAILRRIHVAVRYFEQGNGEGRKMTEKVIKGSRWRPSFEREDFEEGNGGVKVKEKKEGVEENVLLDLNAEPET